MTIFFRRKRLRHYGHVLRMEGAYTIEKRLTMEVYGKETKNVAQENMESQHLEGQERTPDDRGHGRKWKYSVRVIR